MAKLIYAEPDEEITNLVDRLRSEKEETNLVFVLPASSRVMQSGLNARLLMQYSNSLGKKTSVVSPDARTQGTAIESGFTVYPTLTDYEENRSIDRAVAPAVAMAPLDDVGALDDAGVPPGTTPRSSEIPGVVAAAPQPKPVAARSAKAAAGKTGKLPWILGGVGVVLIGLILLLFVLPSATVTIITAARSVSATPTVTGATTAPGGGGDQLYVPTALQQAQESMSQQRNSTGKKDVPAVPATGSVVFHNGTEFSTVTIPSGVELTTDDGKKFVTTQSSDTMSPMHDSMSVSVQAKAGGTAGNVPAGAIKHITNNTDPTITVNNPQPTGNGAEATQKTVVSQTDLDQAKKDLGDQLTQKVKDDIKQKAGSQTLLAETQSITVDANFDHKAGDEAGNFNANVTAKGQQASFDESKMKQVLSDALKRQAPSGYALTDDAPKLDYHVVQHDNSGAVTWEATATGFMAVAVDTANLRKNVTGQSPAKARSYVLGHIDASDVIIHQSPSFIPWLPFISGRIDVREQVQNNTPK